VTTVVLGAGAMGSLVAGRLAAAGVPVVLLGRPSPHLERIAERGLRLESVDGAPLWVRLPVATAPTAAREARSLIVLVKTWATDEALAPIVPYLSADALVVTLQNGLGNRDRVAAALPHHPPASIAVGVTTEGALRDESGVVRHTGHGETLLGLPRGAADARVAALAEALTRSGLPASVAAGIEPALWRKAAVNAAINGLTALAGVENGVVAADAGLAAAARSVAAEVAGVAEVLGVPIPNAAEATIAVAAATARNRSSMLRGLERGTRTEVDAIHGAVVERARAAGTDAPLCATLAAIIRARERWTTAEKGHGR